MSQIKHIVIVGGGTAGWIAASILAKDKAHMGIAITLVESPQIGTIGVGEATIPPFIDMLDFLGIDHVDFIQQTQATYKLGIEFRDWLTLGHNYFHPFGKTGNPMNGLPFYQAWREGQRLGIGSEYLAYSPTSVMAKQHRFAIGKHHPNTPLSLSAHALHIDAGLTAEYLKQFAIQLGVKHVQGTISEVEVDAGIIQSVRLESTETIAGDFFVDCSGFRALLIGQALQTDYLDWSHYLPVNRAVTVQTANNDELPPYTVSKAHAAGWSWHIPLQQRTGNGYVFASEYCSDEEALETLTKTLSTPMLNSPRFLEFTTGYRPESWSGNCLALGLAGGFLEPLESTAIHLVSKGLKAFLRRFPQQPYAPYSAQAFNSEMSEAYSEIRDFLLLHYCLSERKDSAFWRHMTTQTTPKTLANKIGYFKETQSIEESEKDLFLTENWLAIFEGMKLSPAEQAVPYPDLNITTLEQYLKQVPNIVNEAVKQAPPHKDWFN